MKKAVLVVDMPENCEECDFLEWRKDDDWGDGNYCSINGGQCLNCKKPDWCPLRELPEKKDVLPIGAESYVSGWNDYVDMLNTQN